MRRVRELSVMTVLASVCFAAAFILQSRQNAAVTVLGAATGRAPESAELPASGLPSGRGLVAYVFLDSHCGYCQEPATKQAVASVRKLLARHHSDAFRSIKVVGVAIDADVQEGFEYLRTIGLDSFDEISVGSGWRNEEMAQLIWRRKVAAAEVPQIVLVSHSMKSTVSPVTLTYGADSLLAVLRGSIAVADWVKRGVPLHQAGSIAATASGSETSDVSRATLPASTIRE